VAGVVVALGATVAGGVALGTGAVRLGSGGASNGSSNRAALPPATAAVARQDLVDRQSEDGTLGYGDTTTVVNREQGTVTWVPAEGQILRRGATLYRVDTHPVTLMYGSIPFYRALANGVTSGADVKQLEENLRALGYTGFTVDKQFTSATAAAIKRWQDDQGLTQTGSVDVGQVLFLPGPVRVQADKLTVGNVAGPGAPILDVTGKGRIVTVKLAVSDQRLAKKGASVTVDLPSGDTVDGKITKVGTVAHAGSGDNASDSTIDVTVNLAATTSTGAIDQAPVTVNFTSQERKNVLSVPVAALLALSEGGYGVQVVDGSATRIVAVQTGLFADGQVEITGTGITAGTKVGVPAT
jgi:peptidoglycan hydrolase-like protein with peptidoglycan-binding domain